MTSKEVLLSLKDVTITFPKGKGVFTAVREASFDIYRGETFALVGESGSGKTTIGRAIVRINPVAKGSIEFEGKLISERLNGEDTKWVTKSIQMIFQDPATSLNERATVDYIISEGLYNFHMYKDDADRKAKVLKSLTEVGLLDEHITRYPHEFSGGQRQRIGIARAMVMEPKLIVADEPISALDVSIRAQVLNLMKNLQEDKDLTYLFIAHDLSVVRFISDRIAVIHLGRIVELAETEELFKNPLHPYTKSLLSAIPMPDPILESKKVPLFYDGSEHDYSTDLPSFVEIVKGHFVWANKKELEGYGKVIIV